MFNKEIYIARRERLISQISNGILFFPGHTDASANIAANTYKFRQNSSFLYFFGLNKQDIAAIIDIDENRQIIFGDDITLDDVIWMGPQPSMAEQAAEVGITETRPMAELQKYLETAQQKERKIHYLPPFRYHNQIMIHKLLGIPFEKIKECSSLELTKAVISLRISKDEYEIAEMDKACDLGYMMHVTAMKMTKPGMVEQQIVGLMDGIVISEGYMPSFSTIFSQNGETLHNPWHHQIITPGRLCVVDAGAEIESHYCSDFTRTLPCSGHFTQKQADIYNIVLAANNLAIAMSRPGITYTEVHLAACKAILDGLKEVGLLHGDMNEALAAGVQGLFMPHGLGHNIGLDDHDMEDLGENLVGYDATHIRSTQFGLASLRMGRELAKGYVVSDEPGIYFIPALIEKWKKEGTCKEFINFDKLTDYYNFGGIRLEDDVLITEKGCRLLGTRRIPITIEEVEETMNNE
ncbi:MAG: aminopeptidase P N-terminal domain-containing protein [Bacteroidales bacterium]|nr:aminopeptidase P N-terminal domain-containing protein [Bacteroidales bacterium]